MCHPARCRTCGMTTWRGCGNHIAEVRAGVSADQWCPGHSDAERRGGILGWLSRR
jgi:hypothetical protein